MDDAVTQYAKPGKPQTALQGQESQSRPSLVCRKARQTSGMGWECVYRAEPYTRRSFAALGGV